MAVDDDPWTIHKAEDLKRYFSPGLSLSATHRPFFVHGDTITLTDTHTQIEIRAQYHGVTKWNEPAHWKYRRCVGDDHDCKQLPGFRWSEITKIRKTMPSLTKPGIPEVFHKMKQLIAGYDAVRAAAVSQTKEGRHQSATPICTSTRTSGASTPPFASSLEREVFDAVDPGRAKDNRPLKQ